MPRLGLNIDHVATLRQARYRDWKRGLAPEPDVAAAARLAVKAGVEMITVHLREDRRHIQDADVRELSRAVSLALNLEMAATPAMTAKALLYRPDEVCLVPENRAEVTTEGGLDVAADARRIKGVIKKLNGSKIEVSVFVDADPAQIAAAHAVGAQAVELHTGAFANAAGARAAQREIARHARAAAQAHGLGLRVNAGHGLHYQNVRNYLEEVPHLDTLNIGHAIVARALFTGLGEAIAEMQALLRARSFSSSAE